MRNDQDNANQRLESVNEHKGRPDKNKCAARQARSLREIKIHVVGLFCVFLSSRNIAALRQWTPTPMFDLEEHHRAPRETAIPIDP